MRKNHIILAIFGIIIALLMCMIDVNARKAEKYEETLNQREYYYELGNDLENYYLDVILETDIFDDINEEEREWLDYLDDEGERARYYIELITLCEKYYGKQIRGE